LANFLELRHGEVQRRPGPMDENSQVVASLRVATPATKSERFDAEGVPPCCCRVLSAASERLLATVNFAEFLFHVLRGEDPNKEGEQRPLGAHSPVSPPTLRLNPLGRLALGSAQWKLISRLALSLHDVSRDNAAIGSS
jgi:hypothetical protein